ncbi:MAG: hypothetical protein IJW40_06340 [Clostridia bacterium]|nr:hypothetical protein [Clostridia bacterium]
MKRTVIFALLTAISLSVLSACQGEKAATYTVTLDHDDLSQTETIEVMVGGTIEKWWVIDKKADGSAYLLTSRYILDWRAFGPAQGTEDDVPAFLSDTFYPAAFSSEEQTSILSTYLADVGQTQRVFSLNEDEVALMVPRTQRSGFLTSYAAVMRGNQTVGATSKFDGYVSYAYFLRGVPTGIYKCYTCTGVEALPQSSDYIPAGVRPAMWVDAAYVEARLMQGVE